MSFSPTDALSMNVTLTRADQSFSFDCLEASYQARMHGMYQIRALVVSDVGFYAFEHAASNLQLESWGKVTITSTRFNHSHIFQGTVRRLEGTSKFANGKELVWIECLAECQDLFLNRRSGIYLGASALEIIDRGLTDRFNQLGYKQTQVSKSLSQNDSYYPIQNSITQFGESDLAFIFRNLSEYGIWANFRQDFTGNSGVTLLVADHNGALNNFGSVEILQKMDHEGAGLYNIECDTTQVTNTVRAIYFDESQNQYVMKTESLPTIGSNLGLSLDHHCMGNLLTDNNVEAIATIVKDSLRIKQQVLTANFQGLDLQPGDVIQVPFHGSTTPFVITNIEYEFAKGDEERGASAQFSQNHRLTAMALTDISGETIPYRAPIWLWTEEQGFHREYPNYNYRGVLSGCYGMPTGEIVVPDQLGNIPVMFPYNYTEVCGNVPARYTRLISLSNQGGVTGRTFPIYKDTELQIMFANGNMDYPLIKGAAANADTGHVHSSTVQQRTHYALPQGQYLTYSNVPGDHNFVTMGAQHTEGQNRSFMMLSNEQDPNNPGMKKLDSQMITNQSHERVTSGDFHSLQAGNSNIINNQVQAKPITYIRFVIGDQTNIKNPTIAPMLDDYLQGIGADFVFTKQDGTELKFSGGAASLTGKVYAITQTLSKTTDPSVPVDIKQVQIILSHNGRNGTDSSLAVNIIAQNTKPIFPTNTITVQASDWEQNKQVDQYGNITYIVNLNLLAPAFIFNFRQDYWENKLEGDDKVNYQVLKPYFEQETYQGAIRTNPLSKHELDFFETMGNNVTIFIHGYNVGFGTWPTGLQQTTAEMGGEKISILEPGGQSVSLCRDDDYCKTAFPQVPKNALKLLSINQRYGSEAHKWILCMEHSLNKAIGFDGQDYSKYERLIGISWQGNPASPLDYSVANSTTIFPAEQVFALVQQLHERGIKINIMAHSLGNGVLMRVLDKCGANGIQIDHAFLWDAAIPNTSFDDNSKKKFMPLILSNPITGKAQQIPYEFNFPSAVKGVKRVSILYSQQDTVLGAIPSGDDAWTVLHQTTDDPGAGLALALTAGGTQALSDALEEAGIKRPLNSVYYISNLFTYPLSFFTNGSRDALEGYYQHWLSTYAPDPDNPASRPHWQDDDGQINTFATTLETQRSIIASKYPGLFNLISNGALIGDTDSAATKASYNNLTDKEKASAAALDALHLLAPIATNEFATGDSLTPEGEHASDVATIILSGLLCTEAQPDQALGYTGVNPQSPYLQNLGSTLFQSDQTKPGTQPTDKDHYLCVDHNAMLFPTDDFMTYIYKGVLFNAQTNIKFQYFGKWKPA